MIGLKLDFWPWPPVEKWFPRSCRTHSFWCAQFRSLRHSFYGSCVFIFCLLNTRVYSFTHGLIPCQTSSFQILPWSPRSRNAINHFADPSIMASICATNSPGRWQQMWRSVCRWATTHDGFVRVASSSETRICESPANFSSKQQLLTFAAFYFWLFFAKVSMS